MRHMSFSPLLTILVGCHNISFGWDEGDSPPPAPECTEPGDCASGRCESGLCVGCADASDCGLGQICVDTQCGPCRQDAECGEGEVCRDGVCGSACASEDICLGLVISAQDAS